MRFTIATAFSAFVALAAAYTAPDYNEAPSGNAIIYPGLNEIVPEGKPYTIKWDPTTVGPISLVLLRGPSTNVLPLETLAESIPNSGEFTWTPSTTLDADVTHYGLLLVVEGTGQYQYSTQFGISAAVVSSSSSVLTTSAAASTTSSVASSTLETTETTPAAASTVLESTLITTTICPETETTAAATTAATTVATTLATTPAPKVTPTGVSPVKPPTSTPLTSIRLTTSAIPTASPSATPVFNSAGRNAISFGAVMAGVIAAFVL